MRTICLYIVVKLHEKLGGKNETALTFDLGHVRISVTTIPEIIYVQVNPTTCTEESTSCDNRSTELKPYFKRHRGAFLWKNKSIKLSL